MNALGDCYEQARQSPGERTHGAGRPQVFVGFSDCLERQYHDAQFGGKTTREPGEHSLADGGIGDDRQMRPVLLSRCHRQNQHCFFGLARPKMAASRFAPEKHASRLLCLGANARPMPVSSWASSHGIAVRSDRNVPIEENRSVFDVDFKIGDDILRFAPMDCSGPWVPGGGDDLQRRDGCDRARSGLEFADNVAARKRHPPPPRSRSTRWRTAAGGPCKLSKTTRVHRLARRPFVFFRH
jgi:hypothetical protein